MLVEEAGPYGLLASLRKRMSKYGFSPLSCVMCTSVWVSLPFAFENGLVYAFALSGASILIYALFQELMRRQRYV